MTVNNSETTESERFFEVLAGRNTGLQGAEQIRSAILAEELTLREAEEASVEDIPTQELLNLDAIKATLLAEGVFSVMPPKSPAHDGRAQEGKKSTPPSLLSWLQRLLSGPRLAPFAIAATVSLAVLIAYQSAPESTGSIEETGVIRGQDDFELRVRNPAETVARLQSTLEQNEIGVVAAQINSKTWAVRVTPDTPDQQRIANQILLEAGLPINQTWPMQFRVTLLPVR